ncbi:NAD(P)-binding oxidoreductase [Fructilactobacillus frigidiflavus]|uniref:NAD(P)-binding oxidoreductase n=1 Tax=Fructilactobacillus frigidiflavus TaxID=3242688 RepID=UPI003758340A
MKIMIIGGSGRVGNALVEDFLTRSEAEVTIAVAHPERIAITDHKRVKVIKMNLGKLNIAELTKLETGFNAIYFVAGSRGHDLINVDSFGAIKTMIAAEKAGVSRYLMLSSYGSLELDSWLNQEKYAALQEYQAAKFMADNYLIKSTNLNYTILQPSSLVEGKGTGKVDFDASKPTHSSSIKDVARVLFLSLDNAQTYKKVITMQNGTNKIEDALNDLSR